MRSKERKFWRRQMRSGGRRERRKSPGRPWPSHPFGPAAKRRRSRAACIAHEKGIFFWSSLWGALEAAGALFAPKARALKRRSGVAKHTGRPKTIPDKIGGHGERQLNLNPLPTVRQKVGRSAPSEERSIQGCWIKRMHSRMLGISSALKRFSKKSRFRARRI